MPLNISDVTNIPAVPTQRIITMVSEKLQATKPQPNGPIGIYDSGVGGITVLTEVMKQMPEEDVIYLADTARVPYGGRSAQEIIKFNREIIHFMLGQGVKMIIVGCNTSCALAYQAMREEFPAVPIQGMIGPGARAAANATKNNRIGLIATVGTIESKAYEIALTKVNKNIAVTANACPLFVPLIEGGFIDAVETLNVAKIYLKPILEAEVDTLIYGCTHYPYLEKVISKIMGPEVALVDPAEESIKHAKKAMDRLKLGNIKPRLPKYTYFVTGSVVQFQDLGSKLLGKPLGSVKQATLSK
ncbi:MAG: glutamate racemase [Candidatus Saganbacteria bacterium]|nr:glutamate racemase [Candidatus Saganbacteria bacterium]